MTAIPTPFGSQAGKYAFLGSMALKNCHAEVQGKEGKSRVVIVPSEGLVEHCTVTGSPWRGFIYLEDLDLIYTVHESSIYKVNSAGTVTYVGAIPGVDKVRMTRNKKATPQITIRCNAGNYYVESDQVRLIDDADLPANVVDVATLGEYTLFLHESGRVSFSSQSETTLIDALDFFTAEQSADKGIGLHVDRGELIIGSQFTLEFWPLVGTDVDAPFQFRTVVNRGVLSRDTMQSCDGTLMWAGLAHGGEKGVYRLSGYTPQKISTNEVDRLIESESDPSTLLAFTYGKQGHSMYVLRGTNWTRVYDASTKEWHSRYSLGLDLWRAQGAIGAWNKVIVGDRESGKLFYLDATTYTEDGNAMTFEAITPSMHIFPKFGIVDELTIDFLTGQGVASSTATGFDPMVMLYKSTDGGNSFRYPRHLRTGKRGAYETRVNTHRLGRFGPNGVVWKISVSDPVGRALAFLDARVRPLAA